MSSGSLGRGQQTSSFNPNAETDMEPTEDWAALHRPKADDKKKARDALNASTKETDSSKGTKPAGKNCVIS